MNKAIYTCIVLVAAAVAMGSCKKEYKDAPHPYNEITSFKISYGSDTIRAAISNDSVIVYWSGYMAVPDSISPEILVSEFAQVFPASGTKVPLKTGTQYTVTAQDSSKASYKVYLHIYQDEPEATGSKVSFNVGTAWETFAFTNLIPVTSLTKLFAIGKDGQEVSVPVTGVTLSTITTDVIPASLLDSGYYKLKVVNNAFTVYSTDSAIRVYARPVVSSFSPEKGRAGDVVTITGSYFSATPTRNTVQVNGVTAAVTAATNSSLTITVPAGASTGKITVTVGEYTGTSTGSFTILSAAATTVTTLAGSGTSAIVDGTGTAASFRTIMGLAIDAAGDIYVAENNGNMIRRLTKTGAASFLAGSGSAIFADGTGAAASFYNPVGLMTGNDGVVYVADFWNHRIRKITSAGVATTVAGSGTRGSTDGTTTTAAFSLPTDAVMDASGNIYVADYGNHRIRRISTTGDVTTFAGSTSGYENGTGTAAKFKNPYSLAIDASGNLYVTDYGNHCIRKITPAGVVSTFAGNGTSGFADGNGTAALFYNPFDLAFDKNGFLYVTDYNNHRIRQISPAGDVITWAGSGENGYADGSGSEAKFSNPRGIVIDTDGTMYVSSAYRIRKITPP